MWLHWSERSLFGRRASSLSGPFLGPLQQRNLVRKAIILDANISEEGIEGNGRSDLKICERDRTYSLK